MTKMLDFIELENHRPMELWLQETPEFPAEVGGVGVQPGEAEKRNPQVTDVRWWVVNERRVEGGGRPQILVADL